MWVREGIRGPSPHLLQRTETLNFGFRSDLIFFLPEALAPDDALLFFSIWNFQCHFQYFSQQLLI